MTRNSKPVHVTLVQWQDRSGIFHNPGETGDYSFEPELDRLIAEGTIGVQEQSAQLIAPAKEFDGNGE